MARRALLIANGMFSDPRIPPLKSPKPDVQKLASLLRREDVGGYDVTTCFDCESSDVRDNVQTFFESADYGDIDLILISGHGIKDKWGKLHYAMRDTNVDYPSARSLESRWLIERMEESSSSYQILFIDTCYSGAFQKGVISKTVGSTVSKNDFGDDNVTGRAVITASTAVQESTESEVDGSFQSLFTRQIISGIVTGGADSENSGNITLVALFKYIRDGLKREAPTQNPQPYFYGLDGSLVLALNPVATLHSDLIARSRSKERDVRAASVEDLAEVATSRGPLYEAAIRELKRLSEDDSRFVRTLAGDALRELGALAPVERRSPKGELPPEPTLDKRTEASESRNPTKLDDGLGDHSQAVNSNDPELKYPWRKQIIGVIGIGVLAFAGYLLDRASTPASNDNSSAAVEKTSNSATYDPNAGASSGGSDVANGLEQASARNDGNLNQVAGSGSAATFSKQTADPKSSIPNNSKTPTKHTPVNSVTGDDDWVGPPPAEQSSGKTIQSAQTYSSSNASFGPFIVFFSFPNRKDISPESSSILDNAAAAALGTRVADTQRIRLDISGFAASDEKSASTLARSRSLAVKNYLIGKGISASSLNVTKVTVAQSDGGRHPEYYRAEINAFIETPN